MTSLPPHLRFIDVPGRRPFYRYDPPRNVIDAGVLKMWTTKDRDEAIARATADNLIVEEWRQHRDLLKHNVKDARIDHLIGDYFASPMYKKLAETTKATYKARIEMWQDIRVGGMALRKHRINAINAPMCQRIYDDVVAGGAVVLNNDILAVYRLLFNFAIRRGYLQHNPFTYVKTLSVKQRRVVWEREHVRAFLNVAFSKFEWRNVGVLVYCAYEWGQRPGDMLRLKWENYNIETGVLTLTQSKRGETVTLPATDGLQRVLKQQHADFGFQDYIAPYPKRKSALPLQPYSQANFYNACKRIMELAKLPDELHIRDLRRTAITEMVEMGVPISSIMAVSGHATVASLNPYMKKTLRSATTAQTMRGVSDFDCSQQLPERKRNGYFASEHAATN